MALLDTENENYTKCYKSYFTEQEIHILSEKQRGKLTQTQDERGRQQACAFIDSLAKKMGL
jgi:CTD kinase subunit beta